jgi:hypothetical protein
VVAGDGHTGSEGRPNEIVNISKRTIIFLFKDDVRPLGGLQIERPGNFTGRTAPAVGAASRKITRVFSGSAEVHSGSGGVINDQYRLNRPL